MILFKRNSKGQSAVEFILIAPLLFFIFFAIIQLVYMAYACFAVQRAALAAAQETSLTGTWDGADIQLKAACALSPLASLSKTSMACVSQVQCSRSFSLDHQRVIAEVLYPMAIWVPMVGSVFGKPLLVTTGGTDEALGKAFELLGKPKPDLSLSGVHLPYVIWITFRAETYNEGFTKNTDGQI